MSGAAAPGRDWVAWHEAYDDPASALSQRLRAVQARIRAALGALPAGPVRVVSMCAGQGRDLLGALTDHPRAGDVTARLVELVPANAALARAAAAAAGVAVEVVEADAGLSDPYLGAVPADLVLACGVFGNITLADIERTVRRMPAMCATGATVVWTRHRRPPDQLPVISGWFAAAGFEPVWVSAPDLGYGVAAHRFAGVPVPLPAGERLFTFLGRRELDARGET